MIRQVGGCQPLRGAGRIPAGDVPRLVVPAERRERHDARVEPGVADLRDARDLLPALVASDDDVVDPRPVQLAQAVEPADRALLELGPRADHRQVAAGAWVERERQAEVPLARDVPVAHVPQPVVHPLRVEGRRPFDRCVRVEHRLPNLLGRDEPVVDDAEEERRLAAPARRIAVDDPPGLDEETPLPEARDDGLLRRIGGDARQRPVVVVEDAGLVDRHEHRQLVHAAQLEVLGARARRDVDDARALVERDVVPRDDAVLDVRQCREVVEGAAIGASHQLLAQHSLDEVRVRPALDGVPLALSSAPVLGIRPHCCSDVRRKRPRRRRPDDERLALGVREREADVERRVIELLVLAGVDLVLGDRRAATRTPLRRPMSLVEPASLVDDLEEAPDVLDVRVGERVVVGVPVHPHAEPLRLLGDHLAVLGHPLLAAFGELGEAVFLDLALRVEPERLLDLDLDPETLAVEAVLVALVEAAQRLVALEDVLERPAPGVVHTHRVVRGDGAVDEAEPLAASVLLAQLLERPLDVPEREHLPLERRVIGDTRKWRKDARHRSILRWEH